MEQEFIELVKKIENYKERVTNEEMTKTAFIMPFFEILGYDTRNPFEFVPEFTADVADLKGEKVDYAILINDLAEFIVECKTWNAKLDNFDKQLNRYFNVTDAKIGILTNGIVYKFFTDLEEPNKMDKNPFYEFNILDIKEKDFIQLKKFSKTVFSRTNILDTAEELKYLTLFKNNLKNEFENPSDDFVNCILSDSFVGLKTAKVKEKFRPIIKKAINEHFNELLKEKIENAFQVKIEDTQENNDEIENDEKTPVTTVEELNGYSIVKSILVNDIDLARIFYKDTLSYFGVLLDNNIRKWLCRLYFNTQNKYIAFPVFENGERTQKEEKIALNNIFEIINHKDKIIEILNLTKK